ncbi:uncharacterized protein LOC127748795 isoform X1 [Frankliniella occidentalis]|uniref:Uncharacterized protein LOC127748795 isoform X1 n=2 Tax=Frankliniella occidentalis TaxID=133901 RepID=A0A9C6TZ49_FRAOC|nr:uncharacterized protein LOC127748795 isoform X1 [Frankliniella occidentalis]
MDDEDLLLEDLQFKAAKLLIYLREVDNATNKIQQRVKKGVDEMLNSFLDVLKSKFTSKCGPDDALSQEQILDVIEDLKDQSLFEGLKSFENYKDYLHTEGGLVEPIKIVTYQKEVLKGDTIQLVDVDYGYVVPFLPALGKILEQPEVLHCVNNPQPTTEGVFKSPLDGYVYQNHPVVREHPKALAIQLYLDGVEHTDSASSKSGEHGLTYIYWNLLNIYPELRSTTKATSLYAVVKTSVLKKYGLSRFLQDFVAGINALSSTGVVFETINGEPFFGIFLFSSGDNPASANLGGFKESHFANLLCRQCLVTKDDLYRIFEESQLPMRTKASHDLHVTEIEEYRTNRPPVGEDPSVKYGVNERSVLMDINLCDITKCLPQDLMHDIILGTLKQEIWLLLHHVIVEKKALPISVINLRIQQYSKFCGVNKPSPLKMSYLEEGGSLRGTAAETLNLAQILPFVLRKKNFLTRQLESVCNPRNLDCYILRLRLLDYLMSEEFTVGDVNKLRILLREHHLLFQELYPGHNIPKFHYELHIPTHILLYGPPRQQWCFRFEAKHAFFKRLWRITRCLKNHSYTLSMRHQTWQASLMLLSKKGATGPFLSSAVLCGASVQVNLGTCKHRVLLENAFPEAGINENVLQHTFAKVHGEKYCKKSAIITSFDPLPSFGQIVEVYSFLNEVVFVYKTLTRIQYVKELNAFKVQFTRDSNLIFSSRMPYRHTLPFFRAVGANFIIVPCKYFDV